MDGLAAAVDGFTVVVNGLTAAGTVDHTAFTAAGAALTETGVRGEESSHACMCICLGTCICTNTCIDVKCYMYACMYDCHIAVALRP